MLLFSLHSINETSLERQKNYLARLTLVKGLQIMWTTSKGKSSKMKRAFYLFLHFSVSLPRMNVEMNVNILRRMGVTRYFISSFDIFLSWGPTIVHTGGNVKKSEHSFFKHESSLSFFYLFKWLILKIRTEFPV